MISNSDKKIIIQAAEEFNATIVILFGSSLDSSNSRDIDIGIRGIKPELFFDFYWHIFSRLSKPVDVINLNKKNEFIQLIEQEGMVIYDRTTS